MIPQLKCFVSVKILSHACAANWNLSHVNSLDRFSPVDMTQLPEKLFDSLVIFWSFTCRVGSVCGQHSVDILGGINGKSKAIAL